MNPRFAAVIVCLVSFLIPARSAVVISEFAADNSAGLQDEDGVFADWIELHNNGTAPVNLAGWSLTDDASDDNKWEFPAVTLGAGQFLVVFASGKDRRVAGANLHTNFSLSAAGEYLALRDQGGSAMSEFAPSFPQQYENKSYGTGQNVQTTQLVAANAPARAMVPSSGVSGTNWTAAGFSHASWTAGTQGVGFESTVPGFGVTNHKANIAVNSTTDAENVITTPSLRSATYTETRGVINYLNTGSGAHHAGDITFPGMAINVDVEDFVLEAVGTVTIPAAGNWTFGVNSDDGFLLTVGTFSTSYPSPRGPGDTLATFNLPAAGDYPLRLVFYERGGGSEVELFAAQGSFAGWTTAFDLVGDTANGGLAVRSVPVGNSGGLRSLIGTDLQSAMAGINASAYVRIPFSIADVSQIQTLTLKAKYDDGFVAWVNGVEIARRNAPATPAWNSRATAPHPNAQAIVYESMDAAAALPVLVNGANNVLAIQLLNIASNDTDALVLAELAEYEVTGTGLHYFSTPSPGNINGQDYYAFVNQPVMSVPHGHYDAPFSIALTCATPGAEIRYTTDGSPPAATTGTIYTAPISITGTTVLRAAAFAAGFTASRVTTQSYFFLDQVIAQPALPAGFPATWGAGVTADYEMDPNITTSAAYSGVIKNALKSIPTLSIVTSMDNMFSPATGIYANPTAEGVAWERPASVEWIDPTGGGHEFQVDCGIRAQGGASRNPGTSPKHGFRLLFKEQYGPTKLKFPMFENSAVDEFDTLVLHARFNDAWVWGGAGSQYIRDMWCRDAQIAMGWPSPHGTYVHLYINGVYWGLYDPGEKPDASFAAQHLGGDKSEYDAVNSNEFIDGNGNAWNTMFGIAGGGLSTDAAYAEIQQYLDVPNFVDYMLVNLYAGNTDWPSHNWTAARRRVAGAGYKFFSWDAEWSFSGNGTDVTGVSNGNTPGQLWQALRGNAEFRRLVGDHAQRHCFNGGILTPAVCDAMWMARAAEIDQAIIGESARWGDYRTEPPMARIAHWLPEQARLRSQYFPQRTNILVQQLRNISCYPPNDAPAFSQHGGSVPAGYSLVMMHPNATGTIVFTTNGTDPRLTGGNIAPGAQTYSAPLILNSHAVVRARVKDGATWSALAEATFYTQQDFTPLLMSEIMFNPPGAGAMSGDEFEFLEFKNTGANALDLTGITFTNGITFTFPAGTSLAPGAFFILARNAPQFAARYSGATVNAAYTGRLDNGGERLALAHPLGAAVMSLTYGDSVPWPIAPDGSGFSLVPVNANANPDPGNAINWRASAAALGSPGADDPTVSIPRVLVNEVLSHSTGALTDSIELFNPNAAPVDIGGWFLSDDAASPGKFAIPAGTIIPAGGFMSFTEADFNPAPGVTPGFSFSAFGDEAYLSSGDGVNLTGYSHGVEFGAAAQDVSFGRHVNSIGDEHFPAQISRTFGTANTGPLIGPVVINEIAYHPEPGYDEFVELRNISAADVALYDPANAGTWRLGGLDYDLPPNLTIPAGGSLLITGIAPEEFRTKYSVPGAVQIAGPYPGNLQDSGERLRLQRPGVPGVDGIPLITVDEVRYNDKTPWPASADGLGPSLQRFTASDYGNDPVNWFASGPTPGTENIVNVPPVVSLVSPANGASFPAVASILIEASATDPDGTITKVEFFNGSTKLGEDMTAPFQFPWSGVISGSYAITAKARDNRQAAAISEPAIVSVTAPPVGNGAGLTGAYYDTVVNFSAPGAPFLTRIDATVPFDWGGGSPHATMGVDSFSVRWTGQVQPRLTGSCGFYTYSDDGVRLWVNGQLLVDNWTDHGPTENAGSISLQAGRLYDVRMEFYENGGGAVAMLSWSPPGESKVIIPQSQLYPAGAPRIATQPLSQTVNAGTSATFTTLASGTAPVTYAWSRGATLISGQTSATLTLTNAGAADAGSYTVIATNGSGSATSTPATLTVNNVDTDGDGIPDNWETANGMNPDSAADAMLDTDGDGQTAREEFTAGTDPRDGSSVLRASHFRDTGGNLIIRFTAVAGKTYTVQWKPALGADSWQKLADVPAGAARTVETPDPGAGVNKRSFYRVVTPQQP